jgi:transcriptional regulator with XRE-family HTH domain
MGIAPSLLLGRAKVLACPAIISAILGLAAANNTMARTNKTSSWLAVNMGAKSPDQIDLQVGQRIRVLRNNAGISQTQTGKRAQNNISASAKIREGHQSHRRRSFTKIAGVLNVPVTKLLGLDEESIATSSSNENSASPLQLLTTPGALRLLRAYAKLEDGVMRRSIVALAENIALRKQQ